MTKVKKHYSGKKSYDFWNLVNSLRGGDYQEMYALGCALQNLEDFVIKALNDILREKQE